MSRLLKRASDIASLVSVSIAASCVVIMALMIGGGAISRYLIARPIPMVDEFGAYLLVAVTFIGAGYVLSQDGHVKVDLIVRMLSKRVAGWLTVATDIISILVTILLIVVMARVTAGSFLSNVTTWGAIPVPVGPVQLLMPVGFFLVLIVFLHVLSTSIKSARQQPETAD